MIGFLKFWLVLFALMLTDILMYKVTDIQIDIMEELVSTDSSPTFSMRFSSLAITIIHLLDLPYHQNRLC